MVQTISCTAQASSRKWWALAGVTLAVLAVSLDLTVLSVALPTLAGALKASESDLQWFSSGYALVLAAAMLPAGLIGDRYGRKKVMMVSLALFAAGSAACAESRSPAEFIAARALLGLAGAGLVVMAVSALAVLFSEDERPKAIGVWAAANMVGFPIGPILGGWLLSHYWWGWVFLMNVPVAILGLVAVASLVPESRAGLRPGFDVPGVLSSSAGLAVLTYGFIQAGQHGWASGGAVAPIVVGMGILLGFLAWQRALWRRPEGQPLIDVSLFRSGAFTWGSVLFAVLTMALVGLLFTLPQYFQAVMGTDAEGSGIRLLPVVGGLLMGLVPAPLIAKRLGAKLTTATGFGILAADLALGATTSVRSGEAFSALCLWGAGVGAGLTMATVASGALAEMSEERAGVGSAVLQALKNTGAPLGSAVLGSVLTSGYRTNLHLGGLPAGLAEEARQGVFQGVSVARGVGAPALLASVRSAFVHGMDATFLAALGFALAGAMIALALLPNVRAVRQPRTGRRREHVVA